MWNNFRLTEKQFLRVCIHPFSFRKRPKHLLSRHPLFKSKFDPATAKHLAEKEAEEERKKSEATTPLAKPATESVKIEVRMPMVDKPVEKNGATVKPEPQVKSEPDGLSGLKDSMTLIMQMKPEKQPEAGLGGLSSVKTEKPLSGLSALTTFGAPPQRQEVRQEKRQKA